MGGFEIIGMIIVALFVVLSVSCVLGMLGLALFPSSDNYFLFSWIAAVIIGVYFLVRVFMGA
jgi:hypothetical protein